MNNTKTDFSLFDVSKRKAIIYLGVRTVTGCLRTGRGTGVSDAWTAGLRIVAICGKLYTTGLLYVSATAPGA